MSTPSIWFYHDGRHPHIYRYEPPMDREQFVACIDELAGTPVEAVSFCLGEGRTMLHDTQVGELLGHNVEKWDHLIFRRAHQNASGLDGLVRNCAKGLFRQGSECLCASFVVVVHPVSAHTICRQT